MFIEKPIIKRKRIQIYVVSIIIIINPTTKGDRMTFVCYDMSAIAVAMSSFIVCFMI